MKLFHYVVLFVAAKRSNVLVVRSDVSGRRMNLVVNAVAVGSSFFVGLCF